MSFMESVKSVFSKYAVFQGRARRSEYWWFVLFNFLVGLALGIIEYIIWGAEQNWLTLLYSLAVLLPGLAVTVRRLHDTSKSGWLIFVGLIPIIGGIMLLVFCCQDSEPGDNKYGSNPKGL